MMRFASLGSGSSGNAFLVQSDATLVLLDCGFGLSETATRLARLALEPCDLDAILVTHEHDDHAAGVVRLARRWGLTVYATHGTVRALEEAQELPPKTVVFDSHAPFAIGDLEVQPYPVPHDSREPAQFVFSDGAATLGVLTDAGEVTPHMVRVLSGLDALVLECNHDLDLLRGGPYPAHLKQRIAGRYGHLDNETAARLVRDIDRGRLQHLVAAHLSQKNNTPELARAALAQALDCAPEWIGVATQEEGFGWRQIFRA